MRITSTQREMIIAGSLVLAVVLGCQSYTTKLEKGATAADETAAISSLRTVAAAQATYAVQTDGNYGSFSQLTKQGLLDARFASENPEIRGYVLTLTTGNKKFSCNADPADEATGRHFYIDSDSAVLHVNPTRSADASDPVYEP